MSDTHNAALDSLLDATLDDLADMPSFVTPPAGAYMATIVSMETKQIGTHPAIEVNFKLLETRELADPTATPVAAGMPVSCAYMMDNEYGQGDFKNLMKPIVTATGSASVREAMEAAKGMEVLIVSKIRLGKKVDGQSEEDRPKYFSVVKLEVA